MAIDLFENIQYLKGVGPKMAEKLDRLKIKRPIDLIYHYPRTYINYQNPSPIKSVRLNEAAVICGEICGLTVKRTPKKWMSIVEFVVSDQTGQIKIIYFNQPYLKDTFKNGDRLYFFGRVTYDFSAGLKSMASPSFSKEAIIVPLYPETKNVTSKYLSKLINSLTASTDLDDFIPPKILAEAKLLSHQSALLKIHRPDNMAEADQAKRRLAFEELYLTSIKAQIFRQQLKRQKAMPLEVSDKDLVKFVNSLPFTLTTAQKKAAWQIITDLKKAEPMNRLLNGDVGSGKTVVAAMAIFAAFTEGYRSIFMAPTEILASQHFESLKKILSPFKIKVGLLTSSRREKGEKPDLVIGTHALLFDQEEIKDVGLIVIDEQHRFGVDQRKTIHKKYQSNGKTPHLLSMTATPIPRTLQLTLYGDLDVSIIDELPKDRLPIKTVVYGDSSREKAYRLVSEQVKKGRQVFVICPLIEESETADNLLDLDKKSATEEYKKLSGKIFPKLKVGLLHGRMKNKEKSTVMEEFSQGKIDILVSTSVVEVGVDVPNATVMMVEDADRFGLAQLHQFRGRIGRGKHQSYCLLMTRSLNPKATERLKALETVSSGFKLAEIDLSQRGPGQIYGAEQSGFDNLRLDWVSDIFILEEAREAAKKTLVLYQDISQLPLLKTKLDEKFADVHLE